MPIPLFLLPEHIRSSIVEKFDLADLFKFHESSQKANDSAEKIKTKFRIPATLEGRREQMHHIEVFHGEIWFRFGMRGAHTRSFDVPVRFNYPAVITTKFTDEFCTLLTNFFAKSAFCFGRIFIVRPSSSMDGLERLYATGRIEMMQIHDLNEDQILSLNVPFNCAYRAIISSTGINLLIKQLLNGEREIELWEICMKTSVEEYIILDGDVVTLIRSRRQRQDYWHKRDLIEKPLLLKAASVYRRCCDRFQGSLDLWRKLFKFLDANRMRSQQSRAYTRALQMHGRNTDLRVEAALWEFFSNASAENARTQLQLAVRMSPEEPRFYEALFRVEVHFVEKIMQRRKFLQDTAKRLKEKRDRDDEDEESDVDESVFDVGVDDAVLQLRVAEIVMKSALRTVPAEKSGAMLLEMWAVLKECSAVSTDAAQRLTNDIETRLDEMENEDSQLLAIRKAVFNKEDEFDAYEKALETLPSEWMHRLFLAYCDARLEEEDQDPLAEMKKAKLLARMLEKGWASEKELNTIVSSLSDVVNMGEKKKLLEQAVVSNPKSIVFWEALLKHRLDNESLEEEDDVKSFTTELNTAFDKVPAEDSFPLWEIALEFAISYTPEQVEKVFSRAFLTAAPEVASRVKMVRLGYLAALVTEEKLTAEERKKLVLEMMRTTPNSAQFYLAVAEQELSAASCDHQLVKSAYNFSVNENGARSVESWIHFIRYSIKKEPAVVGQLHQRAMLQLEPDLCSDFISAWTALQQEEASAALEKEKVSYKRPLESTTRPGSKKPKKEA